VAERGTQFEPISERRVVVRGGGDLGSGVALRLWRCGFPVAILEIEQPLAVRRTVAFSEAVYDGVARVEEANARLVEAQSLEAAIGGSEIPVAVDQAGSSIARLQPFAVVDAILAKRNVGTSRNMAPLVVGLGPGFAAGEDAHAVVETNRGPDLGRVIWSGSAAANTGEPAKVSGVGRERVLRAPTSGVLRVRRAIGDIVSEGDVIADVDGLPIRADFHSLVRGVARDGSRVREGMKVGDIDPRLDPDLCQKVSDKSLAIAGGVLEAVLSILAGRMS
jgi:xanthine dehydrogenase accessory factor